MLQRDTVRRLMPNCPPAIVDGIIRTAPAVFAKYGFDTALVVAQFMAQICHECGAGTELVENLNYSAAGIVRTWPSRFADVAAAMPFAYAPQKLANKVYNGRMGNRAGSNDGWAFRGRGGTNTTGHDGYYKLALKMARDVLNNPDLVNDPDLFLECAVVDFILCGCLEPAKRGDTRTVTKRLNGGLIGLSQREDWFRRWQSALAAEHGAEAVTPPAIDKADGVLQFGDKNFEVKAVQQQLADKGYACGADDGHFHEATRDAVNSFKANEGLPTDGIIDQATKDALAVADDRPVSEARATATAADLRAAGSRTVQSGDLISKVGGLKMLIGGTVAGSGLSLDGLQDGVDKAHQAKGLYDSAREIVTPLLGNPQVLLGLAILALGAVVIWEARKIIRARLDDHRSAANLGR